jgi:hypothetical protein
MPDRIVSLEYVEPSKSLRHTLAQVTYETSFPHSSLLAADRQWSNRLANRKSARASNRVTGVFEFSSGARISTPGPEQPPDTEYFYTSSIPQRDLTQTRFLSV